MVPNFRTVPTVTGALRTILPPTFDPSRLAVVESYPGIEPTPDAKPGEATYREDAPEDVHIDVRATASLDRRRADLVRRRLAGDRRRRARRSRPRRRLLAGGRGPRR